MVPEPTSTPVSQAQAEATPTSQTSVKIKIEPGTISTFGQPSFYSNYTFREIREVKLEEKDDEGLPSLSAANTTELQNEEGPRPPKPPRVQFVSLLDDSSEEEAPKTVAKRRASDISPRGRSDTLQVVERRAELQERLVGYFQIH